MSHTLYMAAWGISGSSMSTCKLCKVFRGAAQRLVVNRDTKSSSSDVGGGLGLSVGSVKDTFRRRISWFSGMFSGLSSGEESACRLLLRAHFRHGRSGRCGWGSAAGSDVSSRLISTTLGGQCGSDSTLQAHVSRHDGASCRHPHIRYVHTNDIARLRAHLHPRRGDRGLRGVLRRRGEPG